MWKSVVLLGYNLVLPVVAVLVAWGWIRKMADRGGLSAKLWERLGFFDEDEEWEPCGGVYVHAVSVGEVLMAVKLIERWRERDPKETFVLAATIFAYWHRRMGQSVCGAWCGVCGPIHRRTERTERASAGRCPGTGVLPDLAGVC